MNRRDARARPSLIGDRVIQRIDDDPVPANVPNFKGVFAIPPAPFTDSGLLDEDALRSCVAFCIRSGAHGLVGPVNASEFAVLTSQERHRFVEVLVEATGGQLPVIAGVSAPSTIEAVGFASHARGAGADAVIAMPPYVKHPVATDVPAFYRALSDAAQTLPVWIQHYVPPVGMPMTAELLAKLLAIPGVDYLKEESANALQMMTTVQALAGPGLAGFMGGMAGRHLIEEHRRGSSGTMPACEVVDLHVQLWETLDAGNEARARALHTRMLPLLTYEAMFSFTMYKEVLVRRGVIPSAATRMPGAPPLDRENHYELDRLLEELLDGVSADFLRTS